MEHGPGFVLPVESPDHHKSEMHDMRLLFHAALAVTLTSAGTFAQVLMPMDQDRHVSAAAEASDGATVLTDANSDQAVGFGPFHSNVDANVTTAIAFAMCGAGQDSQVLANSFSAQGNASGSSSGSWSTTYAYSESIASLDFGVAVKVQYHVFGQYSGYDQGYASFTLSSIAGEYIDGEYGVSAGQYNVDVSGVLLPGRYRIRYASEAYASPSSGGAGYASTDFDFTLELTPLSGSYCIAAPNSAGTGAELAMGGTQDITANDFHVVATGAVPHGIGMILYSQNQSQVPFGDGFLCIAPRQFRVLPVVQADSTGVASKRVDFTAPPANSGPGQIVPASTWNFQLWYRDPMGPGGTGFNASNGLWVTFCP